MIKQIASEKLGKCGRGKQKIQIYPLGFVLKFDPPIIGFYMYPPPLNPLGLLYKHSPSDPKKKVYNIHLKDLIYIDDEVEITKLLFYEHPHYLDQAQIEPEQVLSLVTKLLEFRDVNMEDSDAQDETESQWEKSESDTSMSESKEYELERFRELEMKKLQLQKQNSLKTKKQ